MCLHMSGCPVVYANKSRSRAGRDAEVYPGVGVGRNPFKKRNSVSAMEEVDNQNRVALALRAVSTLQNLLANSFCEQRFRQMNNLKLYL